MVVAMKGLRADMRDITKGAAGVGISPGAT
jgi:hypothetical protein